MARITRRGALCAAVILPFAASPAHAADAVSGGTSITLDGSAATALKRQGVRFVAIEPAAVTKRSLTLPVSTATIGTVARGYHSGVVQLVRGSGRRARRVAITGAQTRLATRSATTARLGTRKVTLLRYAPVRPTLDPAAGTARLTASVSLTDTAVRVLRTRLGLKRFAGRRLGTATLAIARPAATTPAATAPAGAPTGGAPTTPAGNVTAASFTWRPRESFVRYINGGEGTSVSDGATNGPQEVRSGSNVPLVYAFGFPFAAGNSGAGETLLGHAGKVTFTWKARGIDLSFAAPQLALGAAPTASFVFGGATAGAKAGTLVRALDLDLAGAASHTVDGPSETYADVPATLTHEGSEAFAGFYAPGDPFGAVSATWTRTP